jgi:hypothetical protein
MSRRRHEFPDGSGEPSAMETNKRMSRLCQGSFVKKSDVATGRRLSIDIPDVTIAIDVIMFEAMPIMTEDALDVQKQLKQVYLNCLRRVNARGLTLLAFRSRLASRKPRWTRDHLPK